MINKINEMPTLYKNNNNGGIMKWNISVEYDDNTLEYSIKTMFGQVDGIIQESISYNIKGKNIGKNNETTPLMQANNEMESKYKKQLKKGYNLDYNKAINNEVDEIIEGGYFPMLAHTYSNHFDKIEFPAICQPKYDGHRCLSVYDNNYTLWSRTRKKINSVPHIINNLENSKLNYNFDGELYNHKYNDNFEYLTSLIRNNTSGENSNEIIYYIYDINIPNVKNIDRIKILDNIKDKFENTNIRISEYSIVDSVESLFDELDKYLSLGYEGLIIRNFNGLYVNKRSYDLQKVKSFDDDEFEIVDIKISTKGSMAGKAIFVCKTSTGQIFNCKLKGSLENLKIYADNPELVLNEMVTVKFQGYTKNGIPRFPVAIRIRKDI